MVLTLTGCESGSLPCTSSGAASGTIITGSLEGVLGIWRHGETALFDKLAVELHAPSGGSAAEYECGGLPFRIRGAVLLPIPADRMVSSMAVKYVEGKGEQKPGGFAGEAEDARTLEWSIAGGSYEEIGLAMSLTTTFEERLEASSLN